MGAGVKLLCALAIAIASGRDLLALSPSIARDTVYALRNVGGTFSFTASDPTGQPRTWLFMTANGTVDGNLTVNGNLTKQSGSFKIDHLLAPADKYLYHSFVDSPDIMNIYNGTIVLDGCGEAVVTLPAWFEALNRDFRYQLTAIGAPAPNLHIAEEVVDNRFPIAGGGAALKVSWQITGIRHDVWADAHRIPVEEVKSPAERGRYLNPELYGAPAEAGLQSTNRPGHNGGKE